MTNDACVSGAAAQNHSNAGLSPGASQRLAWGHETPIAGFVSVPGTPCRCTVSRCAIERLAGVKRLGPAACLDAVDRFRTAIEAIAASKYLREGAGPERCIHVTTADVAAALPATNAPDTLAPPRAPVAAGIAA